MPLGFPEVCWCGMYGDWYVYILLLDHITWYRQEHIMIPDSASTGTIRSVWKSEQQRCIYSIAVQIFK